MNPYDYNSDLSKISTSASGYGKGAWSSEETDALVEALGIHTQTSTSNKIRWKVISDLMNGRRSAIQCALRWNYLTKSRGRTDLVEGPWSESEDKRLIEGVKLYDGQGRSGRVSWAKVCEHVGTRTLQQCHSRYLRYLQFSLDGKKKKKRIRWTPEMDALLDEGVKKYKGAGKMGGISWYEVAKLFNGEVNHVQCNSRWAVRTNLKYSKKKYCWTEEEDRTLQEAVREYLKISTSAIISWTYVSKYMNHVRSPNQCKTRWSFFKKLWTKDEIERLENAVENHMTQNHLRGNELWHSVAEDVGKKRTPRACLSMWYLLKSKKKDST